MERGEWEIGMAVTGDVAVRRPIKIDVMKGSRNPFMTTVRIESAQHGVNLKVISQSRSAKGAAHSGLFFVGEMLNVLCLQLDTPLYLSLSDVDTGNLPKSVRRIISRDEWTRMFTLGREYGQSRSVFARSLSWYRKGLNSEDQIDKLLAIWLSLEVIGKNSGRNTNKTNSEIVNRITHCFNHIWGTPANWPVVPSGEDWFYNIKDKRNDIAHGTFNIHPESLEAISDDVNKIQKLARAFLLSWEQRSEGDQKLPLP
jgi:hypothetical protein